MKRKLIISLCLSAMMALVSMPAMAQNKVTGNVVDENGEPVIGASITVVGFLIFRETSSMKLRSLV